MSTCAKCNASLADYFDPDRKLTECPVLTFCLQKRLDNLHSLLRSVTGKLEEAAELLEPPNPSPEEARDLVVSVLEVLS